MKGLKFFLFLQFVIFLVLAVASIVFPAQLATTGLGTNDALEAKYNGAIYLTLFTATLYAFANPVRNTAVIKALILGDAVGALVGLYAGITAASDWGHSLISIIAGLVLALGLLIYYPRGEKPA